MAIDNALGIDLGTTFSVMARMHRDRAEIVPNSEGERTTPSVLYVNADGSFLAGQAAKDAGIEDPENCLHFVKSHIGDPDWRWQSRGEQYSATELSAEILKKLKADAEVALDSPVTHAVVTIPAHFGDHHRRATKEAAALAGLELLALINEPTASAVAYGIHRSQKPETILVYDLGGGTFDATICHVDGNQISVRSTVGFPELGGKDFDNLILRYVAREFKKAHGLDPMDDTDVLGDLRERVVSTKHRLTSLEQAKILVLAHGKRHSVTITQRQFEELSNRLLTRTKMRLNTAFNDANLGLADVDRVLLTGGATRMPMVRRMLSSYFGKSIPGIGNPDEIVALGAAIWAQEKVEAEKDSGLSEFEKISSVVVVDVLSHSLGIEARRPGDYNVINKILLRRNTQLPCETRQTFYIDNEDATAVRLTVYQGESEDTSACRRVGDFVLTGLPPNRPEGLPIELSLTANEDGIVELFAVDRQSGKSIRKPFQLE